MIDPQALLALTDPTEGDLRELSERYRVARKAAHDLTEVADAIELELAARMESDEVVVAGVGRLWRHPEKRSTWRDEYASTEFRSAVGDTVVKEIALDIMTGEIEPMRRNIATATVELLFDLIPAFSSVKARGRKLGLDASDYRVVSEVQRVELEVDERNPDD